MIEFLMFVNYSGTLFPFGIADDFTPGVNVSLSYVNCIIWMLLNNYWIGVAVKYTEHFSDSKSDDFK